MQVQQMPPRGPTHRPWSWLNDTPPSQRMDSPVTSPDHVYDLITPQTPEGAPLTPPEAFGPQHRMRRVDFWGVPFPPLRPPWTPGMSPGTPPYPPPDTSDSDIDMESASSGSLQWAHAARGPVEEPEPEPEPN